MEGNGEQNPGSSPLPQESPRSSGPDKSELARKAWEQANRGRDVPVDERRSQNVLIEMGIPPMAGGSNDNPDRTPEQNPQEERIFQNAREEQIEEIRKRLREQGQSEERINQIIANLTAETAGGAGGSDQPPRPPEATSAAEPPQEHDENPEEKIKRLINEWMKVNIDIASAIKLAENGFEPTDDQLERWHLERKKDSPQIQESQMPEIEERKTPQEALQDMMNRVYAKSDSFAEFRINAMNAIRPYVTSFGDKKIGDTDTNYMDRFNEIVNRIDGSLDQAKEDLQDLVLSLAHEYTTEPERGRQDNPESFDEYLELLMEKEIDDYKTGGLYELISSDGTINYENFSAWAWSKAIWWDGFSPDDPKLSFFSSAAIQLPYRTITLNDFITDAKFKRRSQKSILIDNDGNFRLDRFGDKIEIKKYHDDENHAKMVSKIIDELWFLAQSRNGGVLARLSMGQDEKLAEALGGFFQSDIFTRGNGFEVLFSTAGVIGENYLDDKNGIAGELAAVAENVYDKIFDLEELQKYLGKTSTFFRKAYLKSDNGKLLFKDDDPLVSLRGKLALHGEEQEGRGVTKVRNVGQIEWDENWYDDEGVLKTREDGNINLDFVRGRFLDYINIFNEQNKSVAIIEELRERLRQSLVEKVIEKKPELLERGSYLYDKIEKAYKNNDETSKLTEDEFALQVRKGIIQKIYKDATRAELTAFTTTRWLGIAGMNDTTATGFDASTKWFQTFDYRKGQSRPDTVGTDLGNIKTIAIYKRVLAPFKEAILTRGDKGGKRKTPQRVIEQIAESFENGQNGREVARELKFNAATSVTYDANHQQRGAASVYPELASGQDFEIDKIITWDFIKGFTTNLPEFTKQFKNRIKQRRYLLSGYGDTDYSNEIQTYRQRSATPHEKEMIARELGLLDDAGNPDISKIPDYRILTSHKATLGSEMLGKQVFNRSFRDSSGNVDWEAVNNTKRSQVWKEAWLLEIAAGIAAHRDSMDLSSPVSFMQLQGFYEILKKIPANVEIDEDNLFNSGAPAGDAGRAFTEAMIKYIRKVSHTENGRMIAILAATEGGKGLVKGLMNALKIFSSTFK